MSCRRRWEDLLPEILSLILSNLHGKDVTIFRSVCRNWNSVPQPKSKQIHHFSEIVKYPFLLTYRDKSSSSILYTPAYNKTYPIGTLFSGWVQIHSSNHGWLLLSDRRVLFFLQPATGDIITLPRLNLKFPNLNEMSFSAPPTSRHCVVFGIQCSDCSSPSTRFAFIRRGDSEWRFRHDYYLNITRLKFRARGLVGSKVMKKNRCTIRPVACHASIRWASSCSAPVFHKGAFYCLSQDRKLGVFDPRKAAWRLLDTTSKNRYIRRSSSSKVYLMESSRGGGGELISVVVGLRREFVRMYRFDDDSRQWQGLRSLGDQVAFLSPTSSIVLQCKQLQVKGLENTIHFLSFDENCNVFYSLSTGRFHSFEGGYIPDDTSYKQLQLNSTWMMPEFRDYSDQQLDWNNNDLPEEEDGTEFDPSICSTSIDDNYIIDTSTTTPHSSSTSTTTRGTPWIVLSHEQNTTLVDLVTNIAHSNDSRIEMFRGKKIYGSSNDGLVLLVDSESGGDCVLLNTNSMTVEPLPTLKFPKNFSRYCSVIDSGSCETVVTIFGSTVSNRGVTSTTIFCRVGDEEWTKNTGGVQVHEASAYQGKIYGRGVIPGTRFFVELELKQRHYKVRTIRGFKLPHNKYMGRIFDLGINVVESGGELLFIEMVFSDIIEDGYLPVVSDVRVSRVDMEGKRTELVKDLGDRAFFVSNGGVGFGCCASELGLERNSIYLIAKYCGNVYKYDYGSHRISKVFSARDHGFEIEELVMFY